MAHDSVTEAAVVGVPHAIKGQAIYAYVVVTSDVADAEPVQLAGALKQQVRHAIGGQFADVGTTPFRRYPRHWASGRASRMGPDWRS